MFLIILKQLLGSTARSMKSFHHTQMNYFNEIKKLQFNTAKDINTVASFKHLIGLKYRDDDMLKYVNTRVGE